MSSAGEESTTAKPTSTTVATSANGGGNGASSTTDGDWLSATSTVAKKYDGLSTQNKHILIGCLVGGFVLSVLIGIGCWRHRRHKRERNRTNPNAPIIISNPGGKA